MRGYNGDDPQILHARWQCDALGIPEREYQAWRTQQHNAKRRGIPFDFTLYAWWMWWRRELAKIGPHATRGLKRGEYMMCRHGDVGPYAEWNVFCGTAKDNQQDVAPEQKIGRRERMIQWHSTHESWLKGRFGAAHPSSKPVVTPLGTFPSAADAGRAHGITRQAVSIAIRDGRKGWHFAT